MVLRVRSADPDDGTIDPCGVIKEQAQAAQENGDGCACSPAVDTMTTRGISGYLKV